MSFVFYGRGTVRLEKVLGAEAHHEGLTHNICHHAWRATAVLPLASLPLRVVAVALRWSAWSEGKFSGAVCALYGEGVDLGRQSGVIVLYILIHVGHKEYWFLAPISGHRLQLLAVVLIDLRDVRGRGHLLSSVSLYGRQFNHFDSHSEARVVGVELDAADITCCHKLFIPRSWLLLFGLVLFLFFAIIVVVAFEHIVDIGSHFMLRRHCFASVDILSSLSSLVVHIHYLLDWFVFEGLLLCGHCYL